jgi:hypothetical protein
LYLQVIIGGISLYRRVNTDINKNMTDSSKGFIPSTKESTKQRYSVWMTDAQHQYLAHIAKQKGIKPSALSTEIITKYIDGELTSGRVDFFLPQNNDLIPILKSLIYGELPEGEKLSHSSIANAARILETEPENIYKLLSTIN